MAKVLRFDPPGGQQEPTDDDAQAWDERVGGFFEEFAQFPQLFDPRGVDLPDEASIVDIVWNAFPATLLHDATSEVGRWTAADADRSVQDEYCEWSVERGEDDKVTRVTFTTEIPEYWDHIARDPDRLLALYRDHVGHQVRRDDLLDGAGRYVRDNVWNQSTTDRLTHLMQANNSLFAAIALVAAATILREHDGVPVISKELLARCAGLGAPLRNSDPQIASVVNAAVRERNDVTLLNPPGLYLDGLRTAGLRTPDGADPGDFWTVERGTGTHVVRARFEVPPDRGYVVGDITSGGRPIGFGAQLADRVTVRVSAVVRPGAREPLVEPCNPM